MERLSIFFSEGFSSSQDCMRISRITYFTFTRLYTKQPAISAKFSVQPKNTIIHPNLNVRGGGITERERERESKGERENCTCVCCVSVLLWERGGQRIFSFYFLLTHNSTLIFSKGYAIKCYSYFYILYYTSPLYLQHIHFFLARWPTKKRSIHRKLYCQPNQFHDCVLAAPSMMSWGLGCCWKFY